MWCLNLYSKSLFVFHAAELLLCMMCCKKKLHEKGSFLLSWWARTCGTCDFFSPRCLDGLTRLQPQKQNMWPRLGDSMLCPDYIANDMRSGLWTTLTLNQMHVAFWKSNTLLSVAVLLQSPWGALWTQPNVEDRASSWPRARALWAMWATWAARELLKSLAKGCDDLWPCLGVIELQAFVFSSYLYTWEALQSHLAQSKRGHCSELAILCCTSAALCLMRSLVRSSKRSVFASTSNCKLYPHAYSWQATRRGIFLILGLPISPRFHATLPKLKDSIWDTISGKTRLYPKLSIQKKKT